MQRALHADAPLTNQHLYLHCFSPDAYWSISNRFAMFGLRCSGQTETQTGQTRTKSGTDVDKIRSQRDKILS
ncbi:MAG: hypothetical protein CME32_27670 [Gimesia sp.]|nr:hypothetical protein [Gimesia sp.]